MYRSGPSRRKTNYQQVKKGGQRAEGPSNSGGKAGKASAAEVKKNENWGNRRKQENSENTTPSLGALKANRNCPKEKKNDKCGRKEAAQNEVGYFRRPLNLCQRVKATL